MNTNEVQAVINMVVEQVSKGVDTVTPLATEIVHQYQMKALILAIGFGVLMPVILVSMAIFVWYINKGKDYDVNYMARLSSFIVAGVGSIFSILSGLCWLGDYFAPIVGLLGK